MKATYEIDPSWKHHAGVFLAMAIWWILTGVPALSQDTPSPSGLGAARLMVDGQMVAGIGSSFSDVPYFALQPIAQTLGVELRIGPLGDSHTLFIGSQQILFGPENRKVVILSTAADDRISRERLDLPRSPIKDLHGLKVTIDFLNRFLGTPLGKQFVWDATVRELRINAKELETLQCWVYFTVSQGQTEVTLEFSTWPDNHQFHFRPEEGIAEVELVGYQLAFAEALRLPTDSRRLVDAVQLDGSKLRLSLAAGTAASLTPLEEQRRLNVAVGRRSSVAEATQEASSPRPKSRRKDRKGLRTIVIDPGHGGVETGAIGPGNTRESDLTLAYARLLRNQLIRSLGFAPERVVLTRFTDEDVPHAKRVAIANENQADLFISLHFNSYAGNRARGAETYFLSREASDQLAAEAAERENRSGAAGGERDEMADLQLILWDLAQSYHLGESQRFANLVQDELNKTLGIRNRGVRQAPFRVLMGTDMPAVLVELGFLSNPEEERKLSDPEYRRQLIDALVLAIRQFRIQLQDREPANGGDSTGGSSTPGPTEGLP